VDRVSAVLKYVFGQYEMLNGDWRAGLMHFVIFWGFIVVALNTLNFLIAGPDGVPELTLLDPANAFGRGYSFIREWGEVLVLVAVGYALIRRLFTRPKRLSFTGEAVVILLLIAILMVTDLLLAGLSVEAGTVALRPPGWHNSLSALIAAALFGSQAGSGAQVVYFTSWWVHFLALIGFLNLLPLGKHFHVLLSVPGIYVSALRPYQQIEKMDFEDESIMEFGTSRLEQLSWKNFLDAYNCTECGRCDFYCPANSTGKELSPRHIITGTRDQLKQTSLASLAATLAATDEGESTTAGRAQFVGEVHKDIELWACTTCHACDTHCPLLIEHVEPIVTMRQHLVLEEEGRYPSELATLFSGLERQGNPWSLGEHKRREWTEELDVPTLSEKPDAEYIYFVGCLASLDDRSTKIARAFVRLLNHAGVSYALLDAETCCGDPARRSGNEYLAHALIEQNAEQFAEAGTRKVVTTCPHCMNTLKHEYRDFGIEFDAVLHHSELLLELLRTGRLQPRNDSDSIPVVFHDSCYLGRYNSIYNAPRESLGSGCDVPVLEAPGSHHDRGLCCGAGGGMMFMEESEGSRVNHMRLEQLLASGAKHVAVSCPFCNVMLADAVNELEVDAEVSDIAILIADSCLEAED
jgi:Fe-S oxidoreductase